MYIHKNVHVLCMCACTSLWFILRHRQRKIMVLHQKVMKHILLLRTSSIYVHTIVGMKQSQASNDV